MKRQVSILVLALVAFGALASPAPAEFGMDEFDVTFLGPKGEALTQAGSHPYEMNTRIRFDALPTGEGGLELEEAAKDILLTQPEGFVGNPTAVPRCSTADFLTDSEVNGNKVSSCPDATAVGTVEVALTGSKAAGSFFGSVHSLEPPPGVAAKLGFWIQVFPITIELGVEESPPYRIVGGPTNISQVVEVVGSTFTLWGTPADGGHDALRGNCIDPIDGESLGSCPANISAAPFLTLPRSCKGPLKTFYRVDTWQHPGQWLEGLAETHDSVGNPTGMSGCGKLGFGPEVEVDPTTTEAESSSGLELSIDVEDQGLDNPDGIAQADIAATELRLPVGMTVNPSAAEGLGVCTKAQFKAASLTVKGCPEASKLGSLEVDTPILENHTLKGTFYLAQQDDPSTAAKEAENPFDSLLAAYLVIRDPELGVFVKLPAKVDTDEATGQIVTTVKDMPAFPLEHVKVHLRSGPRAPLVTPPSCDANPATPGNDPYTTTAILTPSSGAAPLTTTSSFQIDSGPGGGPCPPGGTPPFDPGFEAGAANGAAGAYAPFSMRLTRSDGRQDLTKFSATLPPGLVGKLAGVGKCPDAAVAGAKGKTGRQEQALPSCPATSKIGDVLAGAGVGTALTYVPGSLYLAGPYNGAPLSVAAIVPAVAGPFDVGTVVTRVALTLNPITAQVEVDGEASDPIPHILEGIPVKVRDIRVLANRPDFTLNPTDCDVFQTDARIFGSGANPFAPADDVAVGRGARFQASSCASLGFKPKLAFRLKGGTKRGGHPAFHATYTPKPGDANLEDLVVRLPRSAFLDQAHIRTICTRVQFAANACPAGAQYGTIKAVTPLLDEPLEGPIWLRSSNHNLPDLVFDLHGLVDVEVSTRIDSKNGGIRASIEGAPDAPIAKVELTMQGGKKGLIVNSRNLCAKTSKANVQLTGHNGRASEAKPPMRARCGGGRKGRQEKKGRR